MVRTLQGPCGEVGGLCLDPVLTCPSATMSKPAAQDNPAGPLAFQPLGPRTLLVLSSRVAGSLLFSKR